MRMNGDTLEFNADAFKLDSNAVAEDLLKELPGVIVWGDGTITVNGKEIKQLLVNGKPFFGSESKIATQNIPKKVIDKVQIYQENITPENVLDSISTMNIKLKKGKDKGLFGKFGGGYGTNTRFDVLANANFFSPKIQLGIIANTNNVNKQSDDIQTVIKTSSYKQESANSANDPNLLEKGKTSSDLYGFTFLYDFLPQAKKNISRKLFSDYFNQKSNTDLFQISSEEIRLLDNNSQNHKNNVQNNFNKESQNLKNSFELRNRSFLVNVQTSFRQKNNENQSLGIDSTYYNSSLINYGVKKYNDRIKGNTFEVLTTIQNNKSIDNNSKVPSNWFLTYKTMWSHESNEQAINNNIVFVNSKIDNFNRNVFAFQDERNNAVKLKYGNFADMFFGKNSKYNIFIETTSEFKNISYNREVLEDKDSQFLSKNDELSVLNKNTSQKYSNNISLVRNEFFLLSNRYQKKLDIDLNMSNIIFVQKNSSSHVFQNISRKYSQLFPKVNINYENHQFGKYRYTINANYNVDFFIPNYDDIVPIVDSIGVHSIKVGNLNLLPSNTHNFDAEINYTSLKSKNIFKFSLGTSYKNSANNISHSTNYDELGRSFYSLINVDGYNKTSIFLNADKFFKINRSNFQISAKSYVSHETQPSFIQDSIKIVSDHTIGNVALSVLCNLMNGHSIFLEHEFFSMVSRQDNSSINYKSRNNVSKLAFFARINDNISVKPYVNYYGTEFNSRAQNFLLLNFDVTYRTLKSKNLEIKFSAYDLLNKNRIISNSSTINSIRYTSTNSLSRYFFISLSYYLRKF